MTNLSDSIISVFLDEHAYVLKDTDLSTALIKQGIPCNPDDIRRHVQLLTPALFQSTFNRDGTQLIRVEPKIEVCEDFLGNHCKAEAKTCSKLHVCRHLGGTCTNPNCHFPHDFNRGINHRIVVENKCQHINPILLVKLLRRKKYSTMSASSRPPGARGSRGGRGHNRRGPGRGRGRGFTNQPSSRNFPSQKDDSTRQIDVSFPSSRLAQQIDMEIIDMILKLRDIKIEDKLSENENEYFRRGTIQLERMNDVEQLLISPVLNHHGVNIKFKRTNQMIDKTSFLLKTTMINEQDKIIQSRLNLYVATLIGNDMTSTISDVSSDSEQIILVQCNGQIDFNKVRQAYESRPQLSNKQITLIQIYECDALEIRYNDENKSITNDDLEIIFQPVWNDIFAFNFPTHDCAEVEFINANAFKQCMLTIETIQNQFGVTISPIIDNVDENSDTRSISSIQSVPFNVETRPPPRDVFEDRPCRTTIKLRPDWAMIATHPRFKLEYKQFIQSEFGGEVDINGDEATYIGTFPRQIRGSTNEVILGNKTNDFMQKFKWQKLFKLNQNQVDILRDRSAVVAYSRVNESDYMVAAKLQEMAELKYILFSKTNQRHQTEQPYPHPQPEQLYPRMKQKPEQPHPLMKLQPGQRSPSISSLNSDKSEKSHSLPMMSPTVSTSMYPVTTPEQISMFSIDKFEDRLRQYLHENFNVKTIFERNNVNEKTKNAKPCIIIKITGQMNDAQNATTDLVNLFSSIRTKTFDDKTDGNWTKSEEAIQVIQHHFKLAGLMCICEKVSPTNVNVHFFDITNPQFGVDEQQIDDLIRDKFRSATINYTQQSIASKLPKDWIDLEENIRKHYKNNICFYKESNMMYLFGLTELVKEFRQKFEQIKNKHEPQPCKMTLSERQLNYLTFVAKTDMNKLEKQYKSDGCDISLARLRQHGEFIAPLEMHSKIKDSLEALAQIRDTSFEVNEPGFEVLVNNESGRLITLVKSKCLLEKNIETQRVQIPIPKARVSELEDGVKQSPSTTASASATPNATSVNIGHSTVTISVGDITAQAVDAIVACSSSEFLCKAIIDQAGAQVQKEYSVLKASNQFPDTTSGGTLPCKRIFFIPWSPNSRSDADVKSSLSDFIATAFVYASLGAYKSIAFPAVGCGQFKCDPLIIAKYMLHETRKQLTAQKIKMNISFVLLANPPTIYDAFIQRLNELETIDISVSHKIPLKKKDDRSTIAYDRKTVKITLISSNDNHLIKCKQEIIALAQSFSIKTQLTNKQDMLDWSQNTIYKYYEICLKQHVIPTLDLANTTLELVGPKDAVHEAEKYFYELTSEALRQARIHAVSRGVIWSVELIPNSDTWEQYSFKLNGIIEDASLKQYPYVDIINDKEEKCRIDFSAMKEHHGTTTRRIRRMLVNSTLPSTWEPSNENCKRVTLQVASPEYQNVLKQFHKTMLGKYSQIIKIERIQNERWYKQYDAHRDDFKRRYPQLDESLLFHGCSTTSADKIIQESFNRSFAGVNGIKFGGGVYFHAEASYSHQYAQINGAVEKTMFLVRVLIGKTCKGDSTMKVPPPGYDTTTDGQHIFVVYHDAGAYAEHLITYK